MKLLRPSNFILQPFLYRLTVRFPTVLANGTLAGGGPERPPEIRIAEALERGRERARRRWVVEHALASVLDERADAINGGRDDREAC